jgi:hypothetical protein
MMMICSFLKAADNLITFGHRAYLIFKGQLAAHDAFPIQLSSGNAKQIISRTGKIFELLQKEIRTKGETGSGRHRILLAQHGSNNF